MKINIPKIVHDKFIRALFKFRDNPGKKEFSMLTGYELSSSLCDVSNKTKPLMADTLSEISKKTPYLDGAITPTIERLLYISSLYKYNNNFL